MVNAHQKCDLKAHVLLCLERDVVFFGLQENKRDAPMQHCLSIVTASSGYCWNNVRISLIEWFKSKKIYN